MKYTLACKDLGIGCSWKGEAATKKELVKMATKHAKEIHGYTDEQLNDPKMMKMVEENIKEE